MLLSPDPMFSVTVEYTTGDAQKITVENPRNQRVENRLSLFEGMEKLGLKLEVRKHPQPVLVIDHIEQKPTDN